MSLNNNNKPVYAITPQNSVAALSNGSSVVTLGSDSNGVAVIHASAAGTRVYSLVASNSDTNAVSMLVYILNSTTVTPLGIVSVPGSAGNSTTIGNFDVLANLTGLPYDNTGKVYIELGANCYLKVGNTATQTSGKTVYVSAMAADYQ